MLTGGYVATMFHVGENCCVVVPPFNQLKVHCQYSPTTNLSYFQSWTELSGGVWWRFFVCMHICGGLWQKK